MLNLIEKPEPVSETEVSVKQNRMVSPRGQQNSQPKDFTTLINEIGEYFDVDANHILYKTLRGTEAPQPRHITIWFLRHELRWKWHDIELAFAGKSRSALINSYERATILINKYPELTTLINSINVKLNRV